MSNVNTIAKSVLVNLGQFTGGPSSYNPGSVDVRVFDMPARQTSESRLVSSVALVDMPAMRTFPRCVARVNGDEWNTEECGLISNEGTQLRKRPTMQNYTLLFPNRYPFANVGQFFDRNSLSGAFGFFNDLLADYMISMASKVRFFARKFLETALRGASAFLLELRTKAAMTVSDALQFFTTESLTVRGGGYVSDAQVYAKVFSDFIGNWFRDLTGSGKIKLAFLVDKFCLTTFGVKHGELFGTTNKGDYDAFIENTDRDGLILQVPSQYLMIIVNCSMYFKGAFNFIVKLVSIRYLRNTTDSDVRWKIKNFANSVIRKLMNTKLFKFFSIPCFLRS